MNRKLINLIDRARYPRDKNFREYLYIFLICCGISLFIWFLIKMSDEYISEVTLPIKYENAPSDMLLVHADENVSVRIRAMGGNIFSKKFFSGREAVNINLKQADIKKSRYFDRYYILTSTLLEGLSDRFEFNHHIISLDPDTLYLEFEEIVTKSVPVKAMLNVDCKPQYQVYGSIAISPEEVLLSGPSSVIDTIDQILSKEMTFSNLDQNVETKLGLVLLHKDDRVSYSESEVAIHIQVEKFTESSIEIPVRASSNDPGIEIRTFPENVMLTYTVAIKDYKLVNPGMFALSVFYDTEDDVEKTLLRVKVDQHPEFTRVTRIHPDRLEFLIQK